MALNFCRNFKVSCRDQINIAPRARKLERKPRCRITLSRISDNIADNKPWRSETLKFKEPRRRWTPDPIGTLAFMQIMWLHLAFDHVSSIALRLSSFCSLIPRSRSSKLVIFWARTLRAAKTFLLRATLKAKNIKRDGKTTETRLLISDE